MGAIFRIQTTLGVNFAQIFRDFAQILGDFAQIFRDFARIFNKSKLLGMRLHPLPPTPLLASIPIYSSLSRMYWLNARIQEFPLISQAHSVRAQTLSRKDTSNIQKISFFNQLVLFLCKQSDVPVPSHITSL